MYHLHHVPLRRYNFLIFPAFSVSPVWMPVGSAEETRSVTGQLGWLQQGYHERETRTEGISGCTAYVKGKLLNCVSVIL